MAKRNQVEPVNFNRNTQRNTSKMGKFTNKNFSKVEKKHNKPVFLKKSNNNPETNVKSKDTTYIKKRVNNSENENNTGKVKKPFNKKEWRLKKYSKKYKLEKWEENRKQAVLKQYYKELSNEKQNFNVKKAYEECDSDSDLENDKNAGKFVRHPGSFQNKDVRKVENVDKEKINENAENKQKPKRLSAYKKAQLEMQRLKEEKIARKIELQKQREERAEALKKYKEKKMEKFKKLSKKNSKGQPSMKGRMELLLEKIQSNV